MTERKKIMNVLIGAMTIAAVVVSAAFYMYKNTEIASNGPQASPVLNNAGETALQQQLVSIVMREQASVSDCAAVSDSLYRAACEQALSPQVNGGDKLSTSVAEPMTDAQVVEFLQKSSTPAYTITQATTTP